MQQKWILFSTSADCQLALSGDWWSPNHVTRPNRRRLCHVTHCWLITVSPRPQVGRRPLVAAVAAIKQLEWPTQLALDVGAARTCRIIALYFFTLHALSVWVCVSVWVCECVYFAMVQRDTPWNEFLTLNWWIFLHDIHPPPPKMATIGLSKVFILDKYFTELQKFWETERKVQGIPNNKIKTQLVCACRSSFICPFLFSGVRSRDDTRWLLHTHWNHRLDWFATVSITIAWLIRNSKKRHLKNQFLLKPLFK